MGRGRVAGGSRAGRGRVAKWVAGGTRTIQQQVNNKNPHRGIQLQPCTQRICKTVRLPTLMGGVSGGCWHSLLLCDIFCASCAPQRRVKTWVLARGPTPTRDSCYGYPGCARGLPPSRPRDARRGDLSSTAEKARAGDATHPRRTRDPPRDPPTTPPATYSRPTRDSPATRPHLATHRDPPWRPLTLKTQKKTQASD